MRAASRMPILEGRSQIVKEIVTDEFVEVEGSEEAAAQ